MGTPLHALVQPSPSATSESTALSSPNQDFVVNAIGPEIVRNALYGKWCNVLGHSLTRETKVSSCEMLEQKKGKCILL